MEQLGTCRSICGQPGHDENSKPHVRNESCWNWQPVPAEPVAGETHEWEPDFSDGEPALDDPTCGLCGKTHTRPSCARDRKGSRP